MNLGHRRGGISCKSVIIKNQKSNSKCHCETEWKNHKVTGMRSRTSQRPEDPDTLMLGNEGFTEWAPFHYCTSYLELTPEKGML